MKVDDSGRFQFSPQLLKSYLYPLKDIRIADIARWCAECADAGLIAIVEAHGKRYVQIQKFGQRQGKTKSGAVMEHIYFDYDGDGKIHGITPEQLGRWHEMFPAIDVEAELRAASAWLDGNRKQRKTDVRRYLTNWLIRKQDNARKVPDATPATPRYGSRQPLDEAAAEQRIARLRQAIGDDPRFDEAEEVRG